MKTFPANPRVRGFTKEDNEERYKIHRKIRQANIECKIFARSRTITIPASETPIDLMLIKLAVSFGYKIQTEVFI